MGFCGLWSSIRQWESWTKMHTCWLCPYGLMNARPDGAHVEWWWLATSALRRCCGPGSAGSEIAEMRWLRWLRWLIICWYVMYFFQCCFCYFKNFDMIRHVRYECLLGMHSYQRPILGRFKGHWALTAWPIPDCWRGISTFEAAGFLWLNTQCLDPYLHAFVLALVWFYSHHVPMSHDWTPCQTIVICRIAYPFLYSLVFCG